MADSKIVPGETRFRSVIADCNALWEVKRRKAEGVWECEVVDEPVEINGKTLQGDYAGQRKFFSSKEIESAVSLESLFDEIARENRAQQEQLQAGETVFFRVGGKRNAFYRCQVITRDEKPELFEGRHGKRIPSDASKALYPEALVGDWLGPVTRRADGSVGYGSEDREVRAFLEEQLLPAHNASLIERPSPELDALEEYDPTPAPMTPAQEWAAYTFTELLDLKRQVETIIADLPRGEPDPDPKTWEVVRKEIRDAQRRFDLACTDLLNYSVKHNDDFSP